MAHLTCDCLRLFRDTSLVRGTGVAATSATADTLTVESGWLYPGIDNGRTLPYALSATKDTLMLTIGGQPEIFVRESGGGQEEMMTATASGCRVGMVPSHHADRSSASSK